MILHVEALQPLQAGTVSQRVNSSLAVKELRISRKNLKSKNICPGRKNEWGRFNNTRNISFLV